MLNIEKYKDQILNIHKEKWLSIECAIGNVRGVHLPCNQKCNDCQLLSLTWLSEEYKEPVLAEVEKAYLSAVIKPFRKNVNHIAKIHSKAGAFEYICIRVNDYEVMFFPKFEENTMYKGMKLGRKYTLEELGL